jgi:hypothetical protein
LCRISLIKFSRLENKNSKYHFIGKKKCLNAMLLHLRCGLYHPWAKMLAINVYCYYVHNDHRKVTFFDIIGSGIALFVQQMDAINTKLTFTFQFFNWWNINFSSNFISYNYYRDTFCWPFIKANYWWNYDSIFLLW